MNTPEKKPPQTLSPDWITVENILEHTDSRRRLIPDSSMIASLTYQGHLKPANNANAPVKLVNRMFYTKNRFPDLSLEDIRQGKDHVRRAIMEALNITLYQTSSAYTIEISKILNEGRNISVKFVPKQ